MIVAGVDPGTKRMGVCVIESIGSEFKLIWSDTIEPKKMPERSQRLFEMFRILSNVFQQHRPRLVVVETAFVFKNVQSALALGEARGIVAIAAGQISARLVDMNPMTVKKAVTGSGNSDKSTVKRMAELLLNRPIAGPLDSSDAAALALAGAIRLPPEERIA